MDSVISLLAQLEEKGTNNIWYILGAALVSAVTILLRDGGPWVWKYFEKKESLEQAAAERKREDLIYEDEKIKNGYEFVIASVKEQNDKLEKERKEQIDRLSRELKEVSQAHAHCEKQAEGMKVALSHHAELQKEMRAQIVELKARIDKSDAQRREQERARRQAEDDIKEANGEIPHDNGNVGE